MKRNYTEYIIIIDFILIILLFFSGINLLIDSKAKTNEPKKEFFQCMIDNKNDFSKCKKYIN